MSVLRAEIKQRLGDHSIYDGVVEYADDFDTEPILEAMHYGSLMICLNLDKITDPDNPPASDLYVKQEDGEWTIVTSVNKGKDGESAYEVAVDNGYVGTEEQWLASLQGPPGQDGQDGQDGAPGPGLFYATFTKQGNVWWCDKDTPEIYAAYEAGQEILFRIGDQVGIAVYTEDDGTELFTAQFVVKTLNSAKLYWIQYVVGYTFNVLEVDLPSTSQCVPSGGTAGQVLRKSSSTNYDASWADDNTFKVTFEFNYGPPDYELSISCDKTLSEIQEAFAAGKFVYATDGSYQYLLVSVEPDDGTCQFINVGESVIGVIYTPMGSNDWLYESVRYEESASVVQSSDSSISLTPSVNTIYKYGALTALTISSVPAYGDFVIKFTSGSTATVLTVPNDLVMPDGFAVEANTRYEISVSEKYAACMGWPTT